MGRPLRDCWNRQEENATGHERLPDVREHGVGVFDVLQRLRKDHAIERIARKRARVGKVGQYGRFRIRRVDVENFYRVEASAC